MRFAKTLSVIAAGMFLGTWVPFVIHEYGHAIGAWYTGVEVKSISTVPWDAYINTDGVNLATMLSGVASTTIAGALFPFVVRRDGPGWAIFGWCYMISSLYLAVFFMPIGTATDGDVISMMTDPLYAWVIGAVSVLVILYSMQLLVRRPVAENSV